MATQDNFEEEAREMLKYWEEVDGMYLPPLEPGMTVWKEQIPNVRKMALRRDDVILCAYPKAGTHWIWEVISMLLLGKAEYENRPKEQLMMEFVDVKKLEQLTSPRILNTHLPFSMLPVPELKAKGVKVVHVYRNPKDTVVSFYFMNKLFPKVGIKEFEPFFKVFFSKQAMFGSYFDYLKQMHEFEKNNPDVPILTLSYENMKKDPVKRVKDIARFLQVDASDKLCEEIELACRFDMLKKRAENKKKAVYGGQKHHYQQQQQQHQLLEPHAQNNAPAPAADAPAAAVAAAGGGEEEKEGEEEKKSAADGEEGGGDNRQVQMFRKGQVGDWKNHLTVAMSDIVDEMVKDNMQGLPYVLQFV